MPAIETIGFSATAPGSTGATATVFTGDTATVRGAPGTTGAMPIAIIARTQAAGLVRMTRASGHDLIRGWQANLPAATTRTAILPGHGAASPPGEAISVFLAGSGTAGHIERALITLYYPDIPTLQAALIDYDTLRRSAGREVTVDVTLAAATTGGWSGEEALNAESDLLRSDRRYALTGFTCPTDSIIPAIRGPSTANLRIAGPPSTTGYPQADLYFVELARLTDLPTIPVIYGADRAAYLIGCSADQAGGSPRLTLHLLEIG